MEHASFSFTDLLVFIGVVVFFILPQIRRGRSSTSNHILRFSNNSGGGSCKGREIIMANQEGLQVVVTMYNSIRRTREFMTIAGKLHGFTGNTVTIKDGNQYVTYDTERNVINVRPL